VTALVASVVHQCVVGVVTTLPRCHSLFLSLVLSLALTRGLFRGLLRVIGFSTRPSSGIGLSSILLWGKEGVRGVSLVASLLDHSHLLRLLLLLGGRGGSRLLRIMLPLGSHLVLEAGLLAS